MLAPTHTRILRKAARELLEIAHGVEAVQVGRMHIEKINGPMLFSEGASLAEYKAGLELEAAVAARIRDLREYTPAGADCLPDQSAAAPRGNQGAGLSLVCRAQSKSMRSRDDRPLCHLFILLAYFRLCSGARPGVRRLRRGLLHHIPRRLRPRRVAARFARSQRVPGHQPTDAPLR